MVHRVPRMSKVTVGIVIEADRSLSVARGKEVEVGDGLGIGCGEMTELIDQGGKLCAKAVKVSITSSRNDGVWIPVKAVSKLQTHCGAHCPATPPSDDVWVSRRLNF